MRIGSHEIGKGQPCYVIAEIGVNHNGDVELAKKLILEAAKANADAVKFQKRSIPDLLVAEFLDADYKSATALGKTYREHREKLELSKGDYQELFSYAQDLGIDFLASAWDIPSVDFLNELGVQVFKIPSSDLTNIELVRYIAKKKQPILLSTGMSTLEEIKRTKEVINSYHDLLVLLHCVSVYPADNHLINLNAMKVLEEKFGTLVGYSGHERGLAVSLGAVVMGACVLERHFTLDRTMRGPDHAASLEFNGLYRLVRDIRILESAFGDGSIAVLPEEKPNRDKLGKSLVTLCEIPKGTIIRSDMIGVKGPGIGLPVYVKDEVVDRVCERNLASDVLLPDEIFEWPKENEKLKI